MKSKALEWLYKELKHTRVSLGNAEMRKGIQSEELENLRHRIRCIEFTIACVIASNVEEPA